MFRQDRNRLAGIIEFLNVDGERTEKAYSSITKEAPTTVNGLEALETDTEFKSGQMVLNMKDSGKTIELTEKENSSILTAIFMTEIG